MREIKFRAWQKYHKRMLEVKSISFNNNKIVSISTHTDDNVIPTDINYTDEYKSDFWLTDERGMCLDLMQFTGLKDKNGREIYEGDLVKHNAWNYPFEIIFNEEKARFVCKMKTGLTQYIANEELVVIGNIHQNAELLPEADAQR